MAKLTLTDSVSGGDLTEDVTEVRVVTVRVDFERGIVDGEVVYGSEVGGEFIRSPLNPKDSGHIIAELDQYQDVSVAWTNFQRKLLQRGSIEGILPPGVDED